MPITSINHIKFVRSFRRFGELYAALQLTESARETFRGTACWFLLQQLLLTGDVQRAYMLLTAHTQSEVSNQATLEDACEQFVLESLARGLMSMPRYSAESYSSLEQFQSELSEWMASVEQLEASLPVRISPPHRFHTSTLWAGSPSGSQPAGSAAAGFSPSGRAFFATLHLVHSILVLQQVPAEYSCVLFSVLASHMHCCSQESVCVT